MTAGRAGWALLLAGCTTALVDLRAPTGARDSALPATDTGDIPLEYQPNALTVLGDTAGQRIGSGALGLQVNAVGATLLIGAPEAADGDGAVALHAFPQAQEEVAFGAGLGQLLGPAGSALGQSLALPADAAAGVFAVGAPGVETAYLLFTEAAVGRVPVGEVAFSRLTSDRDEGRFGAALALGDVDGDGFIDAIVGAPEESYAVGRVYLFSGADSQESWQAEDSTASVLGTSPYDTLGSALSAAADLDQDGVLDLVLCMPDYDGDGRDVGGCVVVLGGRRVLHSGRSLWDESSALLYGARSEDRLGDGPQCLWVGDLTGDDQPDVAVGLPGSDVDERPEGTVALFDGTELSGTQSSDDARLRVVGTGGLGASVGASGNSELLLGAPQGGTRGGGAIFAVPSQTGGEVDLRTVVRLIEAEGASEDLSVGGILGGDLFGNAAQWLIFAKPGQDGSAPQAGQVRVQPRP